jgi:fibronectin type 3 domain-containing protein
VTISSVASSNAQYSLSGISFPLTIGAGQSAQFNVAFLPKNAGSDSATLSFSATNSQVTESLTGTGTAPQVDLTWLPSTSQISGYNVYRGTAPGVQSKINTALDPATAYTDTTVAPGTTYYYSATAVDSNGQESAFSTAAEIAVP